MRVYLAGAMTSPDRDLPTLRLIRDTIEALGHDVPTRHVAEPDGRERDAHLNDSDLAARDIAWLEASAAVVAEVTTPSHGVGVEVALAVERRVPVLLLHRAGARVSRLLIGLAGTRTVTYDDGRDVEAAIGAFLAPLATDTPSA